MLDLILGLARDDARIRAVVLDGSRVDPGAPRDIFQDYDVTYLASDVRGMVRDRGWMARFGPRIILQTPDAMGVPDPGEPGAGFAFLMLFADGNRVDLTLHPVDRVGELELDDRSRVLLDKDDRLRAAPRRPYPHRNTPPSPQAFADCCNEFWWVAPYVAKGLWRRELPYAKAMQEGPVRAMLDLMLRWYTGVTQGFTADIGKAGRYLERRLDSTLWNRYRATYTDADYDHVWRSLFVMCDLFRDAALPVGRHFGYDYPSGDDERVTRYLKRVRELPADAAGIF